MPFSYEQVEDQIVTRLQETLSTVSVTIPLPDTQKEVDDNIKAATSAGKALIVVYYDNSAFDRSTTTNHARQTDTMEIICNVRSSKRRGDYGVMNMVKLVKLSLQGYLVDNATRMFLKEIKLEDHDPAEKIFSYNVSFTCSKLQVQNFLDGDDAITDPLLQEVFWKDKSYNNVLVGEGGDFDPNDFNNDDYNTG